MKQSVLSLSIIFSLFLTQNLARAEETARVQLFSPQGTVKQVRQVSVRFSEQMVPFGDPSLVEPFEIKCPEKGRGRWADGRNWVYDFDKDLPAGVNCEFSVRQGLKTLSGKPLLEHREFSFSTGGPSIIESRPREGAESLDERQIFLLRLDAEATEESILSHVSCSIEGINETVGVNIVKGEEAGSILRQFTELKDAPHVLLQCKQGFPSKAMVRLIWGKGVSSPSGVKTTEEQLLSFTTRAPFTAKFTCERENARANCIPVLALRLAFTAPVPWDLAKNIALKGNGKNYKPQKALSYDGDEDAEGEETAPAGKDTVHAISFKAPFPENASFVLEVPRDLKDDAGRPLSNRGSFPLTVRTDAYPPLAKFSSRFGIIELKGDATLPVTLRNIEPQVKTRMLTVGKEKGGTEQRAKAELLQKAIESGEAVEAALPDGLKEKSREVIEGLKGRLRRIRMGQEEKVIEWLKQVASAERDTPLLKGETEVSEFAVPKPRGAKAFEVVGLPLKEPGFYIVEMESNILGASLLASQTPLFVPTAALVTNLSAHFKRGRESSLVWVTTLDSAEPAKEVAVTIRDCNGRVVWTGTTDNNGIAMIKKQLPSDQDLPQCSFSGNYSESPALQGIGIGLFVFAKKGQDMTFLHSTWDEGIEPWRYSLPHAAYQGPMIAHTVFDRTLLRAGETLHMKHFIRKHGMAGFSFLKTAELPGTVLIQHLGSEQRYEFPIKWDGTGVSKSEWIIPREAKLGHYRVSFLKKAASRPKSRTAVGGHERGDQEYFSPEGWESSSFRVEEFRVPLMKAMIQPPKDPLVNATETEVDLFLAYLSGGGAGNAPVKLRSQVQPRHVHFKDYEDFVFANGEVKEGVISRSRYEETEQQEAVKKA